MKKLISVVILSLAMACGNNGDKSGDKEAAAEDEVDVGAGEEISPQMELDSTNARFKVDTMSSTKEAEKQSNPDKESF